MYTLIWRFFLPLYIWVSVSTVEDVVGGSLGDGVRWLGLPFVWDVNSMCPVCQYAQVTEWSLLVLYPAAKVLRWWCWVLQMKYRFLALQGCLQQQNTSCRKDGWFAFFDKYLCFFSVVAGILVYTTALRAGYDYILLPPVTSIIWWNSLVPRCHLA